MKNILITILILISIIPTAQADESHTARIYSDFWRNDSPCCWVLNITTDIVGHDPSVAPTAGLFAKDANGLPSSDGWGTGTMTRIGTSDIYYRNATISGTDQKNTYVIEITWTVETLGIDHTHRHTVTLKGSDLRRTNNNESLLMQNGSMATICDCVGNNWFNNSFRANANFTNITFANIFGGNYYLNGNLLLFTNPEFDAIWMVLIGLAVATALPFVSKTNPIPSVISVVLLLILGAFILANEDNLGDNFFLALVASVIALALCAWRMVAVIITPKEGEI